MMKLISVIKLRKIMMRDNKFNIQTLILDE